MLADVPFIAGGDERLDRNGVSRTDENQKSELLSKGFPRKGIGIARNFADFGDYEVEEEIGRGGQGVVYRARQKSLNRMVALKIVSFGQWAAERHLRRFRLEAEAAARLNHPSIVPIYEIGERDGFCYFSMALVDGSRLDEVIESGSMPMRRAAELSAKLARAVHYAHERGILHRDIKPGNILLDAEGEPHLTDFGLARLPELQSDITGTAELLGTPSYMAPEQARGSKSEVTPATDVYGLGAVLYHLITGHPPFPAQTAYETIRMVLEAEPRPPQTWNRKLDRDLVTICLKCLDKEPRRRYGSALALAQDLECWLSNRPIQARQTGVFRHTQKWVRRNPTAALLIVSLAVLAATMVWSFQRSEPFGHRVANGIAVLPFENLSSDPNDAYFVDGVQDDLLTKLASIADLKVTSRTSVMHYRGKHDTREIAKALGVSHVLEGSVRKVGTSVHINAQLIDASSDSHVWARQYDFDLTNLFAIQSEIAQQVAKQLSAKMSSPEKLAIERRPTDDLAAFDLYNRARNLLLKASFGINRKAALLEAADLLEQAVKRDPSFFQAFCELAHTQNRIYHSGVDHTAARLAAAQAAIEAAFRLRPDAGEAHLARADNLYRGYLDYAGALAEVEKARKTVPNEPRLFFLKGSIERRQGQWEASMQDWERGLELDPRNLLMLKQLAPTYHALRLYPKAISALDRALSVDPNDIEAKGARAFIEFNWKADARPMREFLQSIRSSNPASMSRVADLQLICALAERDAPSARAALAELGEICLTEEAVQLRRPFIEGLIARMIGDAGGAMTAFNYARADQEKLVHAQPNYGPPLCVLGLIDAALGRREEALEEGRRAVELMPVEKDAINGPIVIQFFAMTAAWAGDRGLACEQLATAIRFPSQLGYGQLKLLPFWDPLRGEECFEKIVASLAPEQ